MRNIHCPQATNHQKQICKYDKERNDIMKNAMIKLIVESYMGGIIDELNTESCIAFIKESDLEDPCDLDVLTGMVDALQEASVHPVKRFSVEFSEFGTDELNGIVTLENKLDTIKKKVTSDNVINGLSAIVAVQSAGRIARSSNLPDDIRAYKSRKRKLSEKFGGKEGLDEEKRQIKREIKELKSSLNTADYDNGEAYEIKQKIQILEDKLDKLSPGKRLRKDLKDDVFDDSLKAISSASMIGFGNKIAKSVTADVKGMIKKKI